MEIAFYVTVAFLASDVTRALFVLYLFTIGIRGLHFGILQAALFLSNLLLQIPTGILADRIGRRKAMFAGMGLLALNGAGFLVLHDFFPFLVLFVITGAGFALASGADQALLYDNLKSVGLSRRFLRINSNARAISSGSLGLSIFVGGVVQYHWSWTALFASAVIIKLCGFFAIAMVPEVRPSKEGGLAIERPENAIQPASLLNARTAERSNGPITLRSFFCSEAGRSMIPLICASALLSAVLTPYYIFGQRFMFQAGLSTQAVAIVYAVAEAATASLYLCAHLITRRLSLPRLTRLTFTVACLLLAANHFATQSVALAVLFILTNALPAVFLGSLSAFLNDRYPSSVRAACVSFSTFTSGAAIAAAYIVFGFFLQYWSFTTVLPAASVAALLGLAAAELSFRNLNYFSKSATPEPPPL